MQHLASTSVLLLKSSKYPNEVHSFFSYNDWRATNDHIHQMFDIKRLSMPITTTTQFLDIIDKLLNKGISRDEA